MVVDYLNKNRLGEKRVKRVGWVGLIANLILTAFKLFAGIVGHSQVVTADAIHSLSDGVTDLALIVGAGFWFKPPDEEHPYGHWRIETVVTVVIGAALGVVGVGLGFRAIFTLREMHTATPGWIAFVAAVISIISKEVLYRWTVAVGRRMKSTALIANAWHHRSDGLSSIPAALAVAASAISPSWSFLDHVGAALVSLFILHAAWRIGWPAFEKLVDIGVSRKKRRQIGRIARETGGVRAAHAIRTRYLGPGIQVDLHILVDSAMTVHEGHEISEKVKERLMNLGPDVLDVIVHIEPDELG